MQDTKSLILSNSGAPKPSISESFDASWQADHLNNWQQEYDQISSGQFQGELKQLNFEQMDISREFASQALRQSCYVKRGGFWLGFSQGKQPSKMNGIESDNTSLFWHSGQKEFELVTAQDTVIYSLLIDRQLLDDNTLSQYLNAEQVLNQLPKAKIQALLYLLNRLLNPHNTHWRENCQQKILNDAVTELLAMNSAERFKKPSFARRQQTVKIIREFITSQPSAEPVTIEELCRVAHVSRRTLQYSFNDLLGMSPKQFIKAVRLNQIRRCLFDLNDDRDIYQIAFDFGYFHLGQFSQDYKKLFSQTAGETRLMAKKLAD